MIQRKRGRESAFMIFGKKKNSRRNRITRGTLIAFICICVALAGMFSIPGISGSRSGDGATAEAATKKEIRGVYLSFYEFETLGMKDVSKSRFIKKYDRFLKKAKKYGINTVYFHARAFNDAMYRSKYYRASKWITSKASKYRYAKDAFKSYDPLKVAINRTHKKGMKLYAWLNPYRRSYDYFNDPAKSYSTKQIKKAVKEVLRYKVDGIVFDDYFYSARKGYKYRNSKGKMVKHKVSISAKKKRYYVNRMLKEVYAYSHKIKKNVPFGISPAGNLDYCKSIGADVEKWMSKKGYVDYVMPQIYWTDQWSYSGNVNMFSQRLKLFRSINKRKVDMPIALALYRTGFYQSDDRGWNWSSYNLKKQVKKIRKAGLKGFVLFSGSDLFSSTSKKELYHLKGYIKPVKAKSIRFTKKYVAVKKGKKKQLYVKFTPTYTNPKKVKYKSSNRNIARVSKKGVVRGLKRGKVKITVTTNNGRKATCTVRVK